MSRWIATLCAVVALASTVFALPPQSALAGTTGGISGHVADDKGAPIAGARVTATSPSQSATATSDARGFYSILNLSPDTYALTSSKDGYDPVTVNGITVQADQNARADLAMSPSAKVIGHITTSATVSVVSKNTTGDLYAVNAQAITRYQGSAGGAETLYSQNGVVGSLPGVVRNVGTGGGYAGNGSLSMRGGTTDQVGFELEGIPLNRTFDSANATSFVTNGLASLEVYTGGEPADAGRSMAGYINEQIRRGSYPGGADFTGVVGTPVYNHTVQFDAYGASPDQRFSWYFASLSLNSDYNFADRHNLDNQVLNIPANDAGCADFNFTNGTSFDCTQPISFAVPISQAAWQGFVNPSAAIRDNVLNLHEAIVHNGLSDDLQLLYVVGSTGNPFLYSGSGLDLALADSSNGTVVTWPAGHPWIGGLNQPWVDPSVDPTKYGLYTWPSSFNNTGPITPGFQDHQNTQSSIEKLSYTHVLTPSSFVRLYGYSLYSLWAFDQPTNPYLGDSFYQLHNNANGVTLNYQNQLNEKHLIKLDVDYVKELTLRYNYAPDFFTDGNVTCGTLSTGSFGPCGTPGFTNVAIIGTPFAYWNNLPATDEDVALADSFRASDSLLFEIGARFDRFHIGLTPLTINGPNGIAEQSQNQNGVCLHGYNYPASEPCFGYLNTLGGTAAPGMGNWQDVSGSLNFNEFSPRFGLTYTLPNHDVFRASVGRYVQPPASFGEEYIAAPFFGAADTVDVLNNFYDGLGFTAVHNVKPQDSTNIDASYERDFGGGISAKITPFWRTTRNQILSLPVNPTMPTFVTGYNFGAGRIHGVEILVNKARTSGDGLSATLAATYTDSKIRYERTLGGANFIDNINSAITAYNLAHSTTFPLFDPNGYYSPSEIQSPQSTTPSFDVRWVINLNLNEHAHGWDISPTFNYQSGNPYGDPLLFPDPTGATSFGPDPYTGKFDGLGSFKGPSWLTMNLGLSHDITSHVKGSFLITNVFTSVHNQGYPWEYPTKDQVLAYQDNGFYSNTPLPGPTYLGDNYYPYGPASLNPMREYVFSLSMKM